MQVKYQGKEFESNELLFKYLSENKKELATMKCQQRKFSDSVIFHKAQHTSKQTAEKADINTSETSNVTFIGNTYYWLDSHGDVHLQDSFAQSIREQGPQGSNKIFHLHDHRFEIVAKVGNFTSITEQGYSWRDLGVDRDGVTQALTLQSQLVRDWNPRVYYAYANGEIDQHSVGMQYIRVELAINDPMFEAEYALWQEVFPRLGNPEAALAEGFFWAVREARLFECSCVLLGSNTITPTLERQITDEYDEDKSNKDGASALAANQGPVDATLKNSDLDDFDSMWI